MSEDKGIADFLERKLWNGNFFIRLKYFFLTLCALFKRYSDIIIMIMIFLSENQPLA